MKVIIAFIILWPFVGFLFNGLGRNVWSKKTVAFKATGYILASFICSILAFIQVQEQGAISVHYFDFINTSSLTIPFDFKVDALSSLFLLVITGVGTLIHLYSTAYMHEEEAPHYARYFAYLNLFIFSMLLLVLGDNFVIMFIGWEGVGLCSYLLIGYWFSNASFNYAAKKAFIMNRIGDLGFLLAIFWLIVKLGTVSYGEVFTAESLAKLSSTDITAITLLLFVGAMGKSAQIPLFTWLPDAMAGPTPVSALIHAATMVTAGIYLIVRSNFLFELAPTTKDIILVIGIATTVVAAFIAMRQNDIKKVLAYSTVSQLGLMFVALGMGAYTVALFHVTTHAFFKALLFLGSGSVIHAMSDEQDIRKMGGLSKLTPITHITFLIGTLAIAGFPFLSGFFSKDEILAHAWMSSPVIYGFLMIAVTMTAIYMFRLYFLVFHGSFRGGEKLKSHVHESGLSMTIPLMVLAVLSVFGGILNLPGIVFHNAGHWMSHFLESTTYGLNQIETEHMDGNQSIILMCIASVVALSVMTWAYITYVKKQAVAKEDADMNAWEKLSSNKLYIDELYQTIFVQPILWLSTTLASQFEQRVLNNGIFRLTSAIEASGNYTRKWQSGFLSSYLFWMVMGIIGFISYYIIKSTFWN